MISYDVIIIGAGAAGMMCAIQAGKNGRKVLLLDHAESPGKKIRISGGGRCNFTNLYTTPKNFISKNPHFCVSALSRYTPNDFISLIQKHKLAYHEKTLGQLFLDHSSEQIIDMLLSEMKQANVTLTLSTNIKALERNDQYFTVITDHQTLKAPSIVIATGGLSIPKMGATGFGYEIAKQFAIPVIEPEPALVPFTLDTETLEKFQGLQGVSTNTTISYQNTSFTEGMLFTHRGLSGPAILQISSYWQKNKPITINLLPDQPLFPYIKELKRTHAKQALQTSLATILPKRLAQTLTKEINYEGNLADLSYTRLQTIADYIHHWNITPSDTEGFRTAEVTKGGIDTDYLSSKTYEAKNVPGLYFIGEVVDVTGHLGGFNFQFAWASGVAAGQTV